MSKCQLTYEKDYAKGYEGDDNNATEIIRGTIDGNEIELKWFIKSDTFSGYTGTINGVKIENEGDIKKLFNKYVEVAKMQHGEHVVEADKKLRKELVDKLLNL